MPCGERKKKSLELEREMLHWGEGDNTNPFRDTFDRRSMTWHGGCSQSGDGVRIWTSGAQYRGRVRRLQCGTQQGWVGLGLGVGLGAYTDGPPPACALSGKRS